MNEISKELAQEALNIVKGTKAFVLEQAPDVVQQILRWKTAESIAYLASSAGAILISCLSGYIVGCHYKQVRKDKGREIDITDTNPLIFIPCSALGLVMGIVGVVRICDYTMVLLKLYYAPKVFLIEYLSEVLR